MRFASYLILVAFHLAPAAAVADPSVTSAAVADTAVAAGFAVDLSGSEFGTLAPADSSQHPLARPWYRNIDVWGFGAFWFAATGRDGLRSEAGFEIKESTLFVEALSWEDVSLFMEIQTTPPLADQQQRIRTGEVYVHFRDLLGSWSSYRLGLKAGRIDIPFGEEYLWDMLLFREKGALFAAAFAYPVEVLRAPAAQALALALLSLPQVTHYIVDGFIWKNSERNPGMKALLA